MNIQLLKYATPVLRLRLVTDGTQTHIYRRRCSGENQLLVVVRSVIRRWMHDYKFRWRQAYSLETAKYEGKARGFEWVSHHVDGWVHMRQPGCTMGRMQAVGGGLGNDIHGMLFWNSIPPSALFQTMYVCQVTSNELFKEIKQSGNITWANEGMRNYEQKLVS